MQDELATLLDKVKEVISENESLHERQKSHLLKSVFDHLETETETETEVDLANNNVNINLYLFLEKTCLGL